MDPGQVVLASILRRDAKQNTYKIALIRALNDLRLEYLDLESDAGVVVPLRRLTEFWLAYYSRRATRSFKGPAPSAKGGCATT